MLVERSRPIYGFQGLQELWNKGAFDIVEAVDFLQFGDELFSILRQQAVEQRLASNWGNRALSRPIARNPVTLALPRVGRKRGAAARGTTSDCLPVDRSAMGIECTERFEDCPCGWSVFRRDLENRRGVICV